jgi:anti-sigma B factor antagonist
MQEGRMNVDVKEHGHVNVLKIKGNLMGGPETIAVHDKVRELISEEKKNIVIDLSNVKWMNSSGLGTIMGCLTSLTTAKGGLKLCGVTEKVKSLFMITKLITLFDTFPTVDEAVSAFSKK